MTTDIESELDYNIEVALEKLEASGVAVYRTKARQLTEAYRAKLVRSAAHRQGELRGFQDSSNWIHRKENAWSAISDRELKAFGNEERERARKARNKRDQRARKAKPETPAPTIAAVAITREGFNDRLARLQVWLALPGHRQWHLRRREADIMKAWIAYQGHVARHGRRPNPTQFAGAFTARFVQPMTRQTAQKRLKLLGHLMTAGGPLR